MGVKKKRPQVGEEIRRAREQAGLDVDHVARKLQVQPYRVARIERGSEPISVELACAYAHAIGSNKRAIAEAALSQLLKREGLRYKIKVRRGSPLPDVGMRIKKLRHSQGLSFLDVATALGVSRPRVAQVERGDKVLKPSTAVKLADAMGVERKELLRLALQAALNKGGLDDMRVAVG